jgi:hypothetical protein
VSGVDSPEPMLDALRASGEEPMKLWSKKSAKSKQLVKIVEPKNLSFEDFVKLYQVADCLEAHGGIQAYLCEKQKKCSIEIASIQYPAEVVDGCKVTLHPKFLKNYQIGFLAGMLCHELGAHPMGDALEEAPEEEKKTDIVKWSWVEGLFCVAQDGENPHVQKDHMFATAPDFVRYRVYLDVVVQMAETMLARKETGTSCGAERCEPGVLDKCDVADMIHCYLCDVASIAGTLDTRFHNGGEALFERQNVVAAIYEKALAKLPSGDWTKHVCKETPGGSRIALEFKALLEDGMGD